MNFDATAAAGARPRRRSRRSIRRRAMRVLQPLFCWFSCGLIVGCTQGTVTSQRQSAVLLLDNHGGYSHAGRKIALRSDGSYTDTAYIDVVGDERAKRGRYTLSA